MGFKRGFLIQSTMPPVPTPSILDKASIAFYFTDDNLIIDESGNVSGVRDTKTNLILNTLVAGTVTKTAIGEKTAVKLASNATMRKASGDMPQIALNNHTIISVQKIKLNSSTNVYLPESYISVQDSSINRSGGNQYVLNADGSIASAKLYYSQVGSPVTATATYSGSYNDKAVIFAAVSNTTLAEGKIFINGIKGTFTGSGTPFAGTASDILVNATYKPTPIDAENIFGCVLVYDHILTEDEILEATDKLAEMYGIAL